MEPDLLIASWQFDAGAAYPPLRTTAFSMPRYAVEDIFPFGTDGLVIYYHPKGFGGAGQHDFEHLLMHCVFQHMVPPKGAVRSLWDLAADMAAEYLRTELFPCDGANEIRYMVLDPLPSHTDPRNAQEIYTALLDLFEDDLSYYKKIVTRDDHTFWYETPPADARALSSEEGLSGGGGSGSGTPCDWPAALREMIPVLWASAAKELKQHTHRRHVYGTTPGSREEKMFLRAAAKYDFSRYLRRFSTIREEMQLDNASFDYIPYTFGLSHYGNMPLIEPLEYTESSKIEELVIAIDTSGSCSLPIVERFLAEIEHILMDRENFFRRMNIHIIECDAIIQDHQVIRSREEWQSYAKNLTIKGRGGTDFVPVFTLVEKLRAKGQLRNLKGLLYFTDGDGVYPSEKPPYETAFVLIGKGAYEVRIPDWAVRLYLDPPDPLG